MRRLRRYRALEATIVALGAAELGVRLLSPRGRSLDPAVVDPKAFFSADEIARGARYSRPQLALGAARGAVELAALVAAARVLPRRVRLRRRPVQDGALVAALLVGVGTLPGLPVATIARRRAIAFGLVTQSWRGWALDLVKELAIGAGLAAGAGAGVVALTRRYPRGWWLPLAGAAVLVGSVLQALAPVLLDPLFNDYTPLSDSEVRRDVLELASSAGVEVGEVFSVDASRRTTAANAYVTGLGPTKRVVLFDTLLDRYAREEIRVVVAHELAHVRHRDVPRSVVFAAVVAPPAALAVQRLSWAISQERGTAYALVPLALAGALISGATGLLANRLSRAIERRADVYSLELTGAADAFIRFERAIALQNVADVTPPRWFSALLSTHPSTCERIGIAEAYKQGRAEPAELAPS